MVRFANAIGRYLARQLDLDPDREEVVAFGALALIQNGATVVLLLLFAALWGVWAQVAVTFFVAGGLRFVTGGVHLHTPERCVVITGGLIAFGAIAADWVNRLLAPQPPAVWLGISLLMLVPSLVAIMRRAPVPADTRPLSPEHVRRLRRLALLFAALFVAAMVLGSVRKHWWVAPALAGFILQSFTLMPAGRPVAHWLDHVFIRGAGEVKS